MIETFILYNTILLLSGLFAYYAEHSKTECSRILARFCLFMVLFVPSSLRYDIGTDYINYVDNFYFVSDYKDTEIGFYALTVFLRSLHLPAHSLFVCSAFLTYFPLMFLERKNYTWKMMMYVLLLYLRSYNIVRNSISISFVILSFDLFFCRRKIAALVIYPISILFHYSSFVFLPFFFVNELRCNKVILLAVLLVFGGMVEDIFFVLLNNESKYAGYLFNSHYSGEPSFNTGYSILLEIFYTMFLFVSFLLSKNRNYTLIYLLLAYVVSLFLSKNILIFSRATDVFKVSLVFVVPFYFEILDKKRTIVLSCLTILVYIVLFEVFIKSNNGNTITGDHGISPYRTILNK